MLNYDNPKILSTWRKGKIYYDVISFGKYDCGQEKYGYTVYLNGNDKKGAIHLINPKYREILLDTLNMVYDDAKLEGLVKLANSVLGECYRRIEEFHEPLPTSSKPFKFGVKLKGSDNSLTFFTDKEYKAKKLRTLLEAWQNITPLKKLVTLAELIDN